MSTQQQFVNTLHKLIQDGDEVDRCYAIRSLAAINDQHSTALLIDRLRDDDIDVCVDAVEALLASGVGDPEILILHRGGNLDLHPDVLSISYSSHSDRIQSAWVTRHGFRLGPLVCRLQLATWNYAIHLTHELCRFLVANQIFPSRKVER